MANWAVLKRRENGVLARNCLTEEETVLTERQARYLLKLNGDRDPMKIKGYSREECMEYYSIFEDLFFIREPGRHIETDAEKLYTLYVPEKKRTRSAVPKILNFLLMVSCVPMFVFGLYRMLDCGGTICDGHFLAGYLGGMLSGMILHEAGHAVSCLGYHGRWLEAGILQSFLFPGAYVLLDMSEVKDRLKKVQINLAGVEMNLLLAGVLLFILSYTDTRSPLYEWTGAMLYAVFQNVFLVFINLTFMEGLDGEHVISLLLGDKPVVKNAKMHLKCMMNRKKRRRYFKEMGIAGAANVCVSVAVMLYQIIIPLLFLADIGILVGGIFL